VLRTPRFQSRRIHTSLAVKRKARGASRAVYSKRKTDLIDEEKGLKSMVK